MSDKFLVFGEIGNEMATKFCDWLYNLEDQIPSTVRVYINSPGGSLYAMRAMVDAMQSSTHTIITIGTGHIMSAGHMLFIAGDHRILLDKCKCMAHQYTSGTYGKHHELETQSQENRKIFQDMIDHYVQNSCLTAKQVESKLLQESDVYLTSEEMFLYGLADEVAKLNRAVSIKRRVIKKKAKKKTKTKAKAK